MPGGQTSEHTPAVAVRPPQEREVMNAEEAADFLRIAYDSFRRLAPELPRHRITERRYVYFRDELREWLMRR